MGFRDILTLSGPGMDEAGSYGLWLASACGATITAAAPMVEPSMPPYIAAELPSALLTRMAQEAQETATTALHGFSERARQAGIAAETISFNAISGRVGAAVSRLARCYDATILPQPDRASINTTDIVEATLFNSGRPVIIVPYIRTRHELGTVLIAWDGSGPAARAASDAIPILALARHVQIITVGNGEHSELEQSRNNLQRHLARHGIKAETRRMSSDEVDVANLLLSHAADTSADLIVMGGYGHSRFREIVLGGTTREILRSMTAPVLMSH